LLSSSVNICFIYFSFFSFIYFSNFFSGWGHIVAFTKVLTMYQIYYTWIHLLPLLFKGDTYLIWKGDDKFPFKKLLWVSAHPHSIAEPASLSLDSSFTSRVGDQRWSGWLSISSIIFFYFTTSDVSLLF
jgi:hypothetical protein